MIRRMLAVLWLFAILVIAAAAPLLTVYDPVQPTSGAFESPSANHLLGTDNLGRDFFSRLVYGSRMSLVMAGMAGAIAVVFGTLLGSWSAVSRREIDAMLTWTGNVLLAIPGLLLAMLFVASLGTGTLTVTLAAGISAVPGYMRVARTLMKQIRQEEYILAAESIGASSLRVAWRHIIPNARPRLQVLAITQLAWTFVNITTLSFLGFTGNPSIPEWGAMLNTGRGFLLQAPQLALMPGLAISLTILALHALGTTSRSHTID
ncbi:MAG: ABC transporter permease [Anaerolineales bacterium]|nr:ABC transporter permease [Anaerolineales bacterium]